jgi:hypothetical protein
LSLPKKENNHELQLPLYLYHAGFALPGDLRFSLFMLVRFIETILAAGTLQPGAAALINYLLTN